MLTTQQPTTAQLTARQLQSLEVESWFEVLVSIAREHGLHAKLESRVQKSAIIISPRTGVRAGRVWVDFNGVVCYDLKHWLVHFEETSTVQQAITATAIAKTRAIHKSKTLPQ